MADIDVIQTTLTDVANAIEANTTAPRFHEWCVKAAAYRRMVRSWNTTAPTEPELHSVLQGLKELQGQILKKRSHAHRSARDSFRPHELDTARYRTQAV